MSFQKLWGGEKFFLKIEKENVRFENLKNEKMKKQKFCEIFFAKKKKKRKVKS